MKSARRILLKIIPLNGLLQEFAECCANAVQRRRGIALLLFANNKGLQGLAIEITQPQGAKRWHQVLVELEAVVSSC